MKVKELKEYILKHMTADEALEKLLQGPLMQYEKLKFDEGKEVHPLIIFSMAAMDLGWDFLVEKSEGNVRGLCVGTSEYLQALFEKTNSEQGVQVSDTTEAQSSEKAK